MRWRQYRMYPKQFVSSAGNPAMAGTAGSHAEGTGSTAIFNIEEDPCEEVNVLGTSTWVLGQYLRLVGEYQKSLEKYPNPKAVE